MALRDQPYLPLYIQDFLTDEKLNECEAASVGVYIKIMCLMHKSEHYGKILLKQKDKQTNEQTNKQKIEQIYFFASKFAKLLPFDFDTIFAALTELLNEQVLFIEGDFLVQKRMVRDNEISIKRSKSGGKGGKKTQEAIKEEKDFAKAKVEAKVEANSETENEYINSSIDINNKEESFTINKDEKEKKIHFSMIEIYYKGWETYRGVLNGQAKHLTEEVFNEWKSFVDFVYEKRFEELFTCKFITPVDFAKLLKENSFPKSSWEAILRKILATGIKPEHNLYFRIPEFIGYDKKRNTQWKSNSDKQLEQYAFVREQTTLSAEELGFPGGHRV